MATKNMGFGGKNRPLKRNPILDNLPKSSFGLPPKPQQQEGPEGPPATEPAAPATNPDPAMNLVGGASGQSPLPVGQPMQISGSQLTPMERDTLERVGWKDGDPVPGDMANQLDEAVSAAMDSVKQEKLPLPGDPATPPLQMPDRVNMDELPPEAQARLKAGLQEAIEQQQRREEQQGPVMPGGPGVAAAAAGIADREIFLEDDRGQQPDQPQPAAAGTATDIPKFCDHCGWDQSMPDPQEPDQTERHSFLAALLGRKPWQKTYDLADGELQLTVRMLHPEEVDAIYIQTYAEREAGKYNSPLEFMEGVNRYRIALSIVELRMADDLVKFPESLEGWEIDKMMRSEEDRAEDPVGLALILQQLYEDVLNTESWIRIASKTVNSFNRLVAKLEANIDRPDFWKGTAPPA